MEVIAGFWAYAEDDDLVHVCRGFAWKTLCGRKTRAHIAVSIPKPKVVDCQDCIEAGAYNVPESEDGYRSSHHVAYIEVK